MKKLTGIILAFLITGQLLAGGIDNKQNLGSLYMGEPTRNVAIDAADVAAFNPAGVMLGEEGLKMSVDMQYILKTYEHAYTDKVAGEKVTEKQTAPSPIPNLFATYKKDNWGFFGSLTASGGGGTVDYEDGNFTSYYLCNSFAKGLIAGIVKKTGVSENIISVSFADDNVKAFSAYYTLTTGGSYQVNEQVSVALGARYVYASKSIEASAAFTPTVGGAVQAVQDLELEYSETAHGFGGVVSVNYLPLEALRLALRYESQVNLEFELDDKSNAFGTGLLAKLNKVDGSKSRRDLPGLLGFGANYEVDDKLSFATTFTYYLEKDVDWDSYDSDTKTSYNLASKVSNNSHDLAFSAKYNFTEQIWVTAGYMRTENYLSASDYGLSEQMSPALDCNSYCVGGGYKINKDMSVNIAYMLNAYEDDTDSEKDVTYSKRNDVFAIGFEYRM